MNVCNYFVDRNSDVFVVTLDALSAFDRINVYALLTKLIKRNVPFEVIRMLWALYECSNACLRVSGSLYGSIDIRSGIKQGGIMSGVLYDIYVDDLMKELLNSGCGCMIGDVYAGSIFYADDIILLSGSVRKMQSMLKICENYGVRYEIKFIPVKTNWFCTNVFCKSVDVEFKICGQNILFTNYVAYLGVRLIMRRGKLVVDVNDRIRKFNNCAYDVLVNAKGLNEVN
jgi:hypothetical protein